MNDGDVSFFVCGVRLADGRQSETSAVQSICTRSNDSVYECHLNEFFTNVHVGLYTYTRCSDVFELSTNSRRRVEGIR